MTTITRNIARRQVPEAIKNREQFKASALAGRYTRSSDEWHTGILPDEWRPAWVQAVRLHAYAVWSYLTPILWILPSGEVIEPPVRYSQTTSIHQTYARRGAHS